MTEHFKREEFRCPCGCGLDNIDPELVGKLEVARIIADRPFVINSGCRCMKHNADVGGARHSQHMPDVTDGYCHAADIKATSGEDKMVIVNALIAAGIKRICVYHDKGIVHADTGNPPAPQGLFVL